jgi:hypothetical protein
MLVEKSLAINDMFTATETASLSGDDDGGFVVLIYGRWMSGTHSKVIQNYSQPQCICDCFF